MEEKGLILGAVESAAEILQDEVLPVIEGLIPVLRSKFFSRV